MLFSKSLVDLAEFIQGLSERECEAVINAVVITDSPKKELIELLMDKIIRNRVLTR